jgi:iron(II)-dependent oxidoreductase
VQLSEWAPTDRLADWVIDATDSVLATVADLTDDDDRWVAPYSVDVNPAIWELGHVAWFAEWFVLRMLHSQRSIMQGSDALYDPAAVPHITRWHLEYPDVATTRQYLIDVGDAVAARVRDDERLDSTASFAVYAVMHHDAHTEALTYTRQTLGWSQPVGVRGSKPSVPTSDATQLATGDLEVVGGASSLGASRSQQFLCDGGYERDEFWSPESSEWRAGAARRHPGYWRQRDGEWEHRRFDEWRSVAGDADLAMVHVNWFEADAYCRWARRRLPTEVEWEIAATTAPDGAIRRWLPWGDRDPTPAESNLDGTSGGVRPVSAYSPGDGPWGHRRLIGNVWEWTTSTFVPYPHFEPDAYRDNSEPWFGTRKVLRGGSWTTRSRYVRSTFRNYFTPDRADVFAGFRTCALD